MTARLGVGVLALSVTTVLAQQPARDVRPAPIVGRGVIAGVVVTGLTDHKPLRGAHVTLSGPELQGGRIVITDETGVFRFTGIPAGRFTLAASKPAYLATSYGARRPGGTGVPIALAESASMMDVTLTMQRGGVITGRIVDERGRPTSGRSVSAMRYSFALGGNRQLVSAADAETDDHGVYRLFGLMPGEYALVSNPGLGGNLRQILPGEVDAALASRPVSTPVASASETTLGFSPVYYPGTFNWVDARMVTVGTGDEIGGIDFAFKSVPTVRLSGLISGDSASAIQVRLFGGASGGTTSAARQADGNYAFAFAGIVPGHYTIMAWTSKNGDAAAGATEWASAEVDVTGRNLDGITLQLRAGFTASGRVVFEELGSDPRPQGWTVGLLPVLSGAEAAVNGTALPVGADAGFVVPGVTPARYRVTAFTRTAADAKGRTWFVKSATANGADMLDAPVDLRSGVDVSNMVVTLTTKRTDLSGTLQTASGEAAPQFYVIAFPVNRAFWTSYSRHIKAVRPGSDGKFRFVGLPPGEYYMAALTDVEQGEWLNPAFLEKVLPAAFTITLSEGEIRTQDIQIAR